MGAAVGAVAVIIIVATTIICFRRRRRNNRDLTFDTLQGISTSGAASRQRPNQRYNQNVAPVVYDDEYDYDPSEAHHGHAPGGYGAAVGGHQGYGDNGYDAYGMPLPATYQNPSIFQEDSLAYSTAVAPIGGRSGARVGTEPLPEITYRNGNDLNHPSGGATGYYEDDYSQAGGWNQGGGYIGPKGLWIANPTAEGQYSPQPTSQDMELQQHGFVAPPPVSRGSYEKSSINQYDASSEVASSSPTRPKFRGNNPQGLPESPRLRQLRGGDLFGQDAESGAAGSSTAGSPQDTPGRNASTPPLNSSPRSINRTEMRSFEMARHSPGRSSGEGVVGQSYADDLPAGRGSLAQDRPSMDSNHSSSPNQTKSLRTLKRDDWA